MLSIDEVLHDDVLGHMRADSESSLQLGLDPIQHVLVFSRREALDSCKSSNFKTYE